MTFLEAAEHFQIAPVCKLFRKLSLDSNSYCDEEISMKHGRRDTSSFTIRYSTLGFTENEKDGTFIYVRSLQKRKCVTMEQGRHYGCFDVEYIYIGPLLIVLSPQIQNTLFRLVTKCCIGDRPNYWEMSSIPFSIVPDVPNLKEARIKYSPVSILGDQNSKRVEILSLFSCNYNGLDNFIFDSLVVLKFTHPSWSGSSPSHSDFNQFFSSVSPASLPNLLTVSIGLRSMDGWNYSTDDFSFQTDLTKINNYPQIKTLHLQKLC